MSRVCRSVNVAPSVTMYCSVLTLVLSIVGSYTSDSTPPATVYQTLDPATAAVPTQSLRARSKYDGAPGAPGATLTAGDPGMSLTAGTAPAGTAAATGMASTREVAAAITTRRVRPGQVTGRSRGVRHRR